MAQPAAPKLPSSLAQAIIEQQFCRPAGHIPGSNQGVDLFDVFHQQDPKFLDRSQLSPSEKTAIVWSYKDKLAKEENGAPPKWSEAQKLQRRWITTLCRGVCSMQMTPLRVLGIQTLSRIRSPQLREACGKLQSGSYDASGTIVIQPVVEVLMKEIFPCLQKGFSLLEFSLTRSCESTPPSEEEVYEQAKKHIDRGVHLLEDFSFNLPGDASVRPAHLVDLIADLKMFQTALEDPKNLFPLLLIPLGSCDRDFMSPVHSLKWMRKQCLVLVECVRLYLDSLREQMQSTAYNDKVKTLPASERAALKAQQMQVFEKAERLCKQLMEAAFALFHSEIIAATVAQPHTFDATQIDRMHTTFQSCTSAIVTYKECYSKAIADVDSMGAQWVSSCRAKTGLEETDIPLSSIPISFNIHLRHQSHVMSATSFLDLHNCTMYSSLMQDFQKDFSTLCIGGGEEAFSHWASNIDFLLLKICKSITALDQLSQEHNFQNNIVQLYFHITKFRYIFEDMVIAFGKRVKEETHLQLVYEMTARFDAMLQILPQLQAHPAACSSPAIGELQNLLQQITPWFQGKYKKIPTEIVVRTLLLKAGSDMTFAPKLFRSLITVSRFYTIQLVDLLTDFSGEVTRVQGFDTEGYQRLTHFLPELLDDLKNWKKSIDAVPVEVTEKEMLHYLQCYLTWQQRVDSIDMDGLDQIWALLTEEAQQMHLSPDNLEAVLGWIKQVSGQAPGVIASLQSALRYFIRPLLEWGAPLLLGSDVSRPLASSAHVEVVDDDKEVVVDDNKEDYVAPVPQTVSAASATASPIVRPHTFDEIDTGLKAALLHVPSTPHRPRIVTSLAILREEFLSPDSSALAFSHGLLLFFHTSMVVEQVLKYFLSQQAGLSAAKAAELQATHSFAKLLTSLDRSLDADTAATILSLENFHLTGRYLTTVHGSEAAILRKLARPPQMRNTSVLLQRVHAKALRILKIVHHMLSGGHPIPRLLDVLPQQFPAPAIPVAMRPLIEEASKLCYELSSLRHQLQTHHLTARQQLCLGNTSSSTIPYSRRVEKISRAFEHANDYMIAIDELLPAACNPHACYGRSNALLLNSSLLLEQTMFSLMAYLDIPSQEHPYVHALFEIVQHGQQARPRSFDHDLEASFIVVSEFIAQTPSLPRLTLTPSERAGITSLRHFIGGASRYLADANGEVAEEMRRLHRLSEVHHALETDWLQSADETFLRGRFGEHSRPVWKEKVAEAIFKLQSERIYPLVIQNLHIVYKLMQYSFAIRTAKPTSFNHDDDDVKELT